MPRFAFFLALLSALIVAQTALATAANRPLAVGPHPDGGYLLPTGQRIRPAGQSAEFAGRPVDLLPSADGRSVYVKDDDGLVVLDAQSWSLRQELKLPASGGSMHGLALHPDGKRLYLSTAGNFLMEVELKPDGSASWGRRLAAPGPGGSGASHACGMALSRDGGTLYACLSRNNTLGVFDLGTGKLTREIPVGNAPWDVVLTPDGKTAWVSNWGGRRPREGERTAPSSGTPVLVDERGIASSGTVSAIDLIAGQQVAEVPAGLHPSALAFHPTGRYLYVANANGDSVTVVDVQDRKAEATITVKPVNGLPLGSAPGGLAVTPDGDRLLVACGGSNAIAVASLAEEHAAQPRVQGWIPAGWYPGAVVTDGRLVMTANVKGVGSRWAPSAQGTWHVTSARGSVTRVSLPDTRLLAQYTEQVREDSRIEAIQQAGRRGSSRKERPVPERVGEPSVFRHVVYVIKENRTYDQVLGDLPQGNGDPRLCLFGREVTPNHHALAEEFALLDNFYCNGVISADGHSWATEGNVTDHLEKSFGGFTRSYTFGDDPLTYSASGFLWDAVLARGGTVRNFGEMDYAEPIPAGKSFTQIYQDFQAGRPQRFTQKIGVARLRERSNREYPGWNMRIPDVLRAEVFLKELREWEAGGGMPSLSIVYLPQDHTTGASPGSPTPRAHVADNDLALGRVVEGISKSRFWPRTCVFVVEDDPQDGFDHVDGHRSVCFVASPYTRRGSVVRDFYNQTSVLHTMLRILGCRALNQMDAMSPLMSACFTEKPDLRPYTHRPANLPLDELNPPLNRLTGAARRWAEASLRQNFRKLDAADEDTLNRILWHTVKGTGAVYPARLAGAHGKGLAAQGLRLGGPTEDDEDEDD